MTLPSSLTRSDVSTLEYSLGNSPPKLGSSYCWEPLKALPVFSLPGMQAVRGPASQAGRGKERDPFKSTHPYSSWVGTYLF